MDLGKKSPSPEVAPSLVSDTKKISYPGVTLNDEVAEAFLKDHPCDLGDELTATVKLRVSSLRKDEYGHSVGFDVVALDDVKASGGEKEDAEGETEDDGDESEPDDQEKILGYKRKPSKKEAPGISAKELSD
jgi:hypothetical protein